MPVGQIATTDEFGNPATEQIGFLPDGRTSKLKSGQWTLTNAGTIYTVNLDDWANGVKMYCDSDFRFAFGEDPAAVGSSAFAVGGFAKGGTTEVRTLAPGSSRTLRLRSTTAGAVVTVEEF